MALQASPADSHDGVSQVTHPAEPEHIPRTPIGDNGKDEEDYNSEEDSDFDVNAPAEEDVEEGEGEEDVDGRTADGGRPSKRRKLSPDPDDGDVIMDAEFDSGDEVTIRIGKEKMEKARRKKEGGKKGKVKKGEKKPSDDEEGDDFEIDDDDDVGGEGGFVRTRGMRMRIQEEQRPLAKADGATVDVDALWEKMKAVEPSPIPPKPSVLTSEEGMPKDGTTVNDFSRQTAPVLPGEETITIKRVYKFAGEVITEEKTVPKDSAEAKLYLSSEAEKKKKKTSSNTKGGDEPNHTSDAVRIPLGRPLRRYSRFDPNPPDMIKKSWEKNTAFPGGAGAAEQPKGPKLNTVMKSKLDWAEYVDRAGIKDDLDVHSKAKEGYLGRMDFLNRVDAKREEERRNARLKNL
ncbi:Swr1p complex component [Blastomyces gilchristii SLH14081]|uniref:SWR1-complex protein 5 n=1 Tax=Blastomyces gilchristii (strain SLH14081) TaxID=559298 RepID=A0A179UVQ2_BLAGS|nr:Swr1p complex component [Blastomyces gilchristii SLH14081]OAT12196.1 Swr1p complex component [Blastomyces gilchristii SLH14081]